MLDRERVLGKLDEMNGYLVELRQIRPATIDEYRATEKRRACERLLQISVDCAIDICQLFVSGLRLGLPSRENDLFEKLTRHGIIERRMADALRRMKGCRNILVHEYGEVEDEIVFTTIRDRLGDFDDFSQVVLAALKNQA